MNSIRNPGVAGALVAPRHAGPRSAARTTSGHKARGYPRIGLSLALLIIVLLPACGRRTPPKAPELARPKVIDTLAVERSDTGVQLSWRRPDEYADGTRMPDLGTFTVERAEGDGPFHLIEVLPVTDRERFRKIKRLVYTDTTVTAGERYRYRVISTTLDDYESEASNVVEIQLPLRPGPTGEE